MKAIACFFLMLGSALDVIAQTSADTMYLPEITVTASDPSRYLPGGKQQIIKTDSGKLENLAQAIETQAPVYFIQYGAPGQLASINLRGLGASRTSMIWNGMEINSFTLGQTDFSQIATGNGNEVKIQYGGLGPAYGNGALGGTVTIENNLKYNRRHGVSASIGMGSFGAYGVNLDYRYSNKRFSSSTRVFRRAAKNDFEYDLGSTTHNQQNASFVQYGLQQDLEYRLTQNQTLSFNFWYNDHFREVQPNKRDLNGDEVLDNENTRVALGWHWSQNKWSSKVKGGYTYDYQLYNNQDLIKLYRWFGLVEAEWLAHDDLTVRVGGNLNYLIPEVDAYDENTTQTRTDIYTSAVWNGLKNLSLGYSFRVPMVNGEARDFTQTVSGKVRIYRSDLFQLDGDAQFGSSYRLPTLNDFYWQPGGNPDLKAETSNNLEAGITMLYTSTQLNWTVGARGFWHDVDNWIIWIPGGRDESSEGEILTYWYPDNIQNVLASGVEYQQQIEWKSPVKHVTTSLTVNGMYNRATNKNTISPVDRSKDKQLPYTPKHVINGNWITSYKTWYLGIGALYRSERFVETNNELPALPEYLLWSINAGKQGTFGSLKWSLDLIINNLFNEDYETYENRAMPGRNYQLNLRINYN